MSTGRDLPNDLMIQIILRLPVKSIFRFRSASKYWYTLLKSESFINTYHLSESRKSVLLLRRRLLGHPHEYDDVLSFHDPDSPELMEISQNLSIYPFYKGVIDHRYSRYVKLLGPCDGIVCIQIHDFVMLLNPALREFKRIPDCPFECPQGCHLSILGHGFGKSSSSNSTKDYKVVFLQELHDNPDDEYRPLNIHLIVNVYSLSTNSWKQIDANGKVGLLLSGDHVELFFNGACHWRAYKPHPDHYANTVEAILCFDLSTEVLGWVEYPDVSPDASPDARKFTFWSNLMIIDECLAVLWMSYVENFRKRLMDIWVMKEYGIRESWTKQFVIETENLINPFLPWKNEWVLMMEDEKINPIDELVSYSFRTKDVRRYQFFGRKRTIREKENNQSYHLQREFDQFKQNMNC